MVNIEILPKCISHNGNWYTLNLHITAFNKICISYQYIGGAKRAMEKKIEYNILSNVVESDMFNHINYSNDVTRIIDVPNYKIAFDLLYERVNQAIDEGKVKVVYE